MHAEDLKPVVMVLGGLNAMLLLSLSSSVKSTTSVRLRFCWAVSMMTVAVTCVAVADAEGAMIWRGQYRLVTGAGDEDLGVGGGDVVERHPGVGRRQLFGDATAVGVVPE